MKILIAGVFALCGALLLLPVYQNYRTTIEPGVYLAVGGGGTLYIEKKTEVGQAFDLSTVADNHHSCNLEGNILNGRAFMDSSHDDKFCEVEFQRVSDGIDVGVSKDSYCHAYCGQAGGFTYTYLKVSEACDPKNRIVENKLAWDLVSKKKYVEAKAALELMLSNCANFTHWTEQASIRLSLAQVTYEMKDFAGCLAVLQPFVKDAKKDDDDIGRELSSPARDDLVEIVQSVREDIKRCQKGLKSKK